MPQQQQQQQSCYSNSAIETTAIKNQDTSDQKKVCSSEDNNNRKIRLSSYDTNELRKEMQRVIEADNQASYSNGSNNTSTNTNTTIPPNENVHGKKSERNDNNNKFKTLKDLPDEQDRKRIVGCLAAILAFTFSYDVIEDDFDDILLSSQEQAMMEQHSNIDTYKSKTSFSSEMDYDENIEASFHSSPIVFLREKEEKEDLSHTNSTMNTNNNDNTLNNNWAMSFYNKKSIEEKKKISRHRKRRHEFYYNFLQNCAVLIGLDKAHAIAFAPMLERLLNPPPAPRELVFDNDNNEGSNDNTVDTNAFEDIEGVFQPQNVSDNKNDSVKQEISLDSTSTTNTENKDNNDKNNTPIKKALTASQQLQKHNDRQLIELLDPFLDSLTPGSGYKCISLLLLHHLLTCPNGYDSRVRYALKQLAVLVLSYEMKDLHPWCSNSDLHDLATRKFEALEHGIAEKLLSAIPYDKEQDNANKKKGKGKGKQRNIVVMPSNTNQSKTLNQNIIRGIKIGGAGVFAGTIFALTGGLAAPAIATGLAAISSTVAATAAFATLTSTSVITAIFGVGGGGLAAYKMQRRTKGLTEFNFQKESKSNAELHSIICISGWLKDRQDYQRPWGVKPTKPPITSLLESLERFYFVHKPENVSRCAKILSQWKGQERELWKILRIKYGRDPEHIFPLTGGPRDYSALNEYEDDVLNVYLGGLGFSVPPTTSTAKDKKNSNKTKSTAAVPNKKEVMGKNYHGNTDAKSHDIQDVLLQQIHEQQQHPVITSSTTNLNDDDIPSFSENVISTPEMSSSTPLSTSDFAPISSTEQAITTNDSFSSTTQTSSNDNNNNMNPLPEPPSHLLTVWDFQSQYSGDLYTVKWESDLLLELCDSVTDLVVDIVGKGTREILRHTAVATLLTAVAIPAVLVGVSNAIDETWGLAINRAEMAGIELANCLLENQAGHRPVNLVGFSMGARIIYTCLKELAKHQETWEDLRGDEVEQRKKYSREPASIIEDVILMGMPNHLSLPSWISIRRLISGRLINCYSKNDFILKFLFQFKRMSGILRPVCGTCSVDLPGVENYDVTNFITSHSDYCLSVNDILDLVKFGQPRISTDIDCIVDTDDEDGVEGEASDTEGREIRPSYSF